MMSRSAFAVLLLAAGFAAAQQGSTEEKIREQAQEIARLMRESERLLLEMTRVDRIAETQAKIEEELRKLLPPDAPAQEGAGAEEAATRRRELEARQSEARRKLEEMLTGQKQSSEMTVRQLEELLRSLPRQQGGGGDGQKEKTEKESPEEREKRLREEQQERKQHAQKPRDERDERKERKPGEEEKRAPREDPQAARLKRIEAWIARLPPEEQERINRNDFSGIPLRYRRLVEEYTALRAKREAEREEAERER